MYSSRPSNLEGGEQKAAEQLRELTLDPRRDRLHQLLGGLLGHPWYQGSQSRTCQSRCVLF